MKKLLLLTLFFLVGFANLDAVAQCAPAQQCAYTFTMVDSFGDSWNGNTMNVIQNGETVAVLTGPTNAEGTTPVVATIPLCDGAPFELFWNAGGSWTSEVNISIVNPFGQTIYEMVNGNGVQNSSLFSGTVNCLTPECFPPDQLSVSAIAGMSATFSWTEISASTQWEVFVNLSSMPAPTATTSGTIVNAETYTATGLTPGSEYNFYVRSLCTATSSSDWISLAFTPICDTPTQLIAQSLSSSQPLLNWIENGSATSWEIFIAPAADPGPSATTSGTATTAMPFLAPTLTAGTNYKFYVRAICGPGDASPWSLGHAFTPVASLPPLVTNTTQYTPEQLVTSVLVNNPCIAITNVTSSTGTNFGSANGIGFFTNTNATFPLSSGLILSSGSAANAPGPNTSVVSDGSNNWLGDTQLEGIVMAATGQPMNSYNATKLEFDFTSLNEFMSFNFLFASDEYGTYQCAYADAFAFLLTDLTTGVTTNLAVVPGTTVPVSVVTIRDAEFNNSCVSMNPGFFDSYYDETTNYMSATNYNGQTALMTASSAIIPGNPYHIKLVIADRGDSAYDSSVFIQAGSFTSGPPACSDKIVLVSFVDQNGNGVKDNGEINFTAGNFTAEMNNSGTVNNISSSLGSHTIYDADPANTYDFGYQINAEYASYYSTVATPFNDINIPTNSGTQVFYFPVVLTQSFTDVTVTIVPVTSPVAGQTFSNRIEFRNTGIAPAAGTLTFTKDPAVSIVSVSPSGTTPSATGFTHNYVALQPNEVRSFLVHMSVPAIPVVNIDDVLTCTAAIYAGENDLFIDNNSFSNAQVVAASYDPNDKMEAHGGYIPINEFDAQDYLIYTIRFQNTGTSNAISVRLEDMLDEMLDEESIRVISASHDYVMQRTDNQVTWNFDYIQLPPMLQSEELSKGYVTFKIKVKPGFSAGDIIPNGAEIYFDSNPAIVTNVFNTEFQAPLSTVDFSSSEMLMFPNPAEDTVYIQLKNSSDAIEMVTIYDVVGKQIMMRKPSASQASVDVSALSKGVYMVEVITMSQSRNIRKLIIN